MRVLALLVLTAVLSGAPWFAATQQEDYQQAIRLFQEDQYDQAIDVLRGLLERDPNQALAYNVLGLIYLKQGQSIESAIGSFEQAVRIDPKYADAYFNLASTYAGQANRPQLAAMYFKKTLEADPGYTKAHFGLGWFSMTANEDAETAAHHFQKAIENYPDFAEAHYGLGLAYVQMEKAPLALDLVSKLRGLNREDLANYLETAIRGENLGDRFTEEAPPSEESPVAVSRESERNASGPGQQTSDFLTDLSHWDGGSLDSASGSGQDPFF